MTHEPLHISEFCGILFAASGTSLRVEMEVLPTGDGITTVAWMETGSPSDVRARVEPEQKVLGGKSHPGEGWVIFSAKSLVRWASSPPTKGEQNGERTMNNTILAIRVLPDNPDHHIWNNNGTWWCHYTVHRPNYTKQRVRVSLGTRCQEAARRLRDRVLQNANVT